MMPSPLTLFFSSNSTTGEEKGFVDANLSLLLPIAGAGLGMAAIALYVLYKRCTEKTSNTEQQPFAHTL